MPKIKSAHFEQYDTQDLWQKDRDHFLHPWTDFSVFKDKGSLVMAESDGMYVYDSDGKRYLESLGGLWCVNIGFGREEMAQAIAEQSLRLAFYNTFVDSTTPPAAELAGKLAELTPASLNHVFFSTGGSVANETAIRIVHFYFNQLGLPTKKKVISRLEAFHGSTYLTMALTGVQVDHEGFDLPPDLVHYISAPDTYRRPADTTLEEFCDQLVTELEDKILELGPENVACFIAEPIMGAGGLIVPPPGYHRRMQGVCRKYDLLYISDEVVTAFGRLGHFFSSQPVFDLEPDIITSAKGITSGYIPLGATILSDKIYDAISVPQAEGALFYHGFTYSGHPVCCAAALKNIEIIEREDLCGNVREVEPYFKEQLTTLKSLPIVGDVRGSGFMWGVESVADLETKAKFPMEIGIGNRISRHCEARGVIVRPLGHINVMSPPLIWTRAQIDTLVGTLREAIKATMDDLVREGLWSRNN